VRITVKLGCVLLTAHQVHAICMRLCTSLCYSRVVALERQRLEDAGELSRLRAAGEVAHAAGASVALVLEAQLLGGAAQHRQVAAAAAC
jgi:hypothetical protein